MRSRCPGDVEVLPFPICGNLFWVTPGTGPCSHGLVNYCVHGGDPLTAYGLGLVMAVLYCLDFALRPGSEYESSLTCRLGGRPTACGTWSLEFGNLAAWLRVREACPAEAARVQWRVKRVEPPLPDSIPTATEISDYCMLLHVAE